ncbi:MAG: hypothetical protein WDN69_10125 [Aliidongia sp.]
MHVYIVREPFGGFAKGDTLSQAQLNAYEAKGGHVDHHAIRVWRPDAPLTLPETRTESMAPDAAPGNPA